MKTRRTLFLSVAALAISACASIPKDTTGAGPQMHAAVQDVTATPAGVTLEPLGKAQGYDLSALTAAALARDQIAYANDKGMTLYTWDGDGDGTSLCVDACAQKFIPFLAKNGSAASLSGAYGHWSTIVRNDGTHQWALNGKPLYTYVHDVDPGSVAGDSPAEVGAPRLNGAGEMVGGGNRGDFDGPRSKIEPMPEGWRPALLYPFGGVKVPPGFAIREIPDAAAFALVDYRGHTIYAFGGTAESMATNCGACRDWRPMAAPQLARPIGDFTFRTQADGSRQWEYKGQALYTYAEDLAPGYANGLNAGAPWDVAAVADYYLPESVSLQTTPGQGRVLATADGMTLYRRDGHILQSGGGHSLRRGQPARPAVGRDLGIETRCRQDCDKWRPFLATADARPHGFWNVVARPDGTSQWTYQGYAMWTYADDQKPGDMNGHDVYTVFLAHDSNTLIDIGTPMDAAAALWWSIAVP